MAGKELKEAIKIFLNRHEYLQMYLMFIGYGILYLGPVCLIGGLIEHGWTSDALIPLVALLFAVTGFPLLLFALVCLFRGLIS